MRTLDIIEIDLVAGGLRRSIGGHPLSTSIHHAKAHAKVHHAKAKTTHVHTGLKSNVKVNPDLMKPPGDGDGDGDGEGDGEGDGDGDGAGEGDGYGEGDGGYDGTGTGYATDLPPIPITPDPVSVGSLQVTFTFNSNLTQISATVLDPNSVEHPVISPEMASAIGSLAQAACSTKVNSLGGQMTCAGFGAAVAHVLTNWSMSTNDWVQLGGPTSPWTHSVDLLP